MTPTALRTLTVAVLAVLVMTAPVHAESPVWWDFAPRLLPPTEGIVLASGLEERSNELPASTGISLGRWLDAQSSLGVDVTPLRSDLRLLPLTGRVEEGFDTSLPSTAISLDLKLTWPTRVESAGPGVLQPYVSFGPAVFVAERNPVPNPLATPADVTMRVGVKAGAGVTWQVDRGTAFFSEYRVTRGREDSWLSGVGRSGYDLLYGLRFKF